MDIISMILSRNQGGNGLPTINLETSLNMDGTSTIFSEKDNIELTKAAETGNAVFFKFTLAGMPETFCTSFSNIDRNMLSASIIISGATLHIFVTNVGGSWGATTKVI